MTLTIIVIRMLNPHLRHLHVMHSLVASSVLFEPCLCYLQAVNFGLLNANHLQAGEQYGYIDMET